MTKREGDEFKTEYEYDDLGNRVEKQTYTPYNVYDIDGFSSKYSLRDELEKFI